jgi:hypothetical protein
MTRDETSNEPAAQVAFSGIACDHWRNTLRTPASRQAPSVKGALFAKIRGWGRLVATMILPQPLRSTQHCVNQQSLSLQPVQHIVALVKFPQLLCDHFNHAMRDVYAIGWAVDWMHDQPGAM